MSNKFLLSGVENIEISNVNGLQEELTELEDEIAAGGGKKTVEIFTQQIGTTAAGFGEYKLYAKNDGFYERGTGAEVKLAGGSGGTSIAYSGGTPVISDGMVFSTGISRDFIQNDTGFRLDTTNNKLVVPDLETDDHFSINSTLTGIDYNEATTTTEIAGKLSISAGTGNAVSITAGGNIEMTTTVGQLQTTSAGDTNIRAINGDAYFSSAAGSTAIQSDAAAVGITGGTGVNINATSGDINLTQALLNVKSATNALNSIIVYPEGKSIRFLSGGVQQGTIKLNATYNNILELSGASSLITQNVPNDDYSITNKLYVDGLTGKSYDAIPSAFGNSLTTSTTANFFLRNNMPYKMTINKIRVSVYAAGSGVTRMGVYRGSDTNAVLVGESSQIAAGSLTTFPRYEYTISAVSGQTLLFSKNESYIVALCLDGTTTRFRAFNTGSTYATNDDQWYRSTETPNGFPSTPGSKSATSTTAFCYCLVEN